jgi:hypothetical protein
MKNKSVKSVDLSFNHIKTFKIVSSQRMNGKTVIKITKNELNSIKVIHENLQSNDNYEIFVFLNHILCGWNLRSLFQKFKGLSFEFYNDRCLGSNKLHNKLLSFVKLTDFIDIEFDASTMIRAFW